MLFRSEKKVPGPAPNKYEKFKFDEKRNKPPKLGHAKQSSPKFSIIDECLYAGKKKPPIYNPIELDKIKNRTI